MQNKFVEQKIDVQVLLVSAPQHQYKSKEDLAVSFPASFFEVRVRREASATREKEEVREGTDRERRQKIDHCLILMH